MNMTALADILKEVYLFKTLEDEKLEELVAISKVKDYQKDSLLFTEGELSVGLIILMEGSVKICKHNDKGDKITIGFFEPYALLAEAATLRRSPLPSSAYCVTDVKVIMIEIEGFIHDFMQEPSISYALIQSLLEKVQLLQTNIHMNLSTTAKEKILTFYTSDETAKLKMKNYDIASLLGMNSATFSRNAVLLEKEGKIKKVNSRYEIAK